MSEVQIEVRSASDEDAAAIRSIFAEGIADRVATFETRVPDSAEIIDLIGSGAVVLVAVISGRVVGWARVGGYADEHDYYAGVGEATLYVARSFRGCGVGRRLLGGLEQRAREAGYYKLVGKIFTSNQSSIALVAGLDWREVGVHRRHGRLDSEWRDVLVVERALD